jgi:hypothetical protein
MLESEETERRAGMRSLSFSDLALQLGPTGIDRLNDCVCKHAGSWDESLER